MSGVEKLQDYVEPSEKDIILSNGQILQFQELNGNMFLNTSTILYGPSRSGKTTTLQMLLYALRRKLNMVFAIAPSEREKPMLSNIIPKAAVYTDINEATIEAIKNIWDRQTIAAEVYEKATNLKILEKIYWKLKKIEKKKNLNLSGFETIMGSIMDLELRTEERFSILKDKNAVMERDEYERLSSKKSEIEFKIKSYKITLYKKLIHDFYSIICYIKLTKNEIYAVKYIDFNPNIGLIFDDVTTYIKPLMKISFIEELFYRARYKYITIFLVTHSEVELKTGARSGAMYSIFTSDTEARKFFKRQTNQFDKDEIKEAMEVIEKIELKSGSPRKLMYCRNDLVKFRYYYLDYDKKKFKVGSKEFRRYCRKVLAREDTSTDDNPFKKDFDVIGDKDK